MCNNNKTYKVLTYEIIIYVSKFCKFFSYIIHSKKTNQDFLYKKKKKKKLQSYNYCYS